MVTEETTHKSKMQFTLTVFLDEMLCSSVEQYQLFGGIHCLLSFRVDVGTGLSNHMPEDPLLTGPDLIQ